MKWKYFYGLLKLYLSSFTNIKSKQTGDVFNDLVSLLDVVYRKVLDMNNSLLKNLNNFQAEIQESLKTFKVAKNLSKKLPVAVKFEGESYQTLADYFTPGDLDAHFEACQSLKSNN